MSSVGRLTRYTARAASAGGQPPRQRSDAGLHSQVILPYLWHYWLCVFADHLFRNPLLDEKTVLEARPVRFVNRHLARDAVCKVGQRIGTVNPAFMVCHEQRFGSDRRGVPAQVEMAQDGSDIIVPVGVQPLDSSPACPAATQRAPTLQAVARASRVMKKGCFPG